MKFLFLFLDGVGLGSNNPQMNPFVRARMPTLETLLRGNRLVIETLLHQSGSEFNGNQQEIGEKRKTETIFQPFINQYATLLALDSCLGVNGLPQSATGQAAMITGINIPAALGYHYGPKPNQAVAQFLQTGTLFHQLRERNKTISLLNAYPPSYFQAIERGYRIYSAIPLAMIKSGIVLKTIDDLLNGKGLSADFTGLGWRERLGIVDTPLLTPEQAGEKIAILAQESDLTFFDFWLSDYAGHKQNMKIACNLLETFDRVLSSILTNWNLDDGVILITSDHGNLEDLSTRRHTTNPVPALVIGASHHRHVFTNNLLDLTNIKPAILNLFP